MDIYSNKMLITMTPVWDPQRIFIASLNTVSGQLKRWINVCVQRPSVPVWKISESSAHRCRGQDIYWLLVVIVCTSACSILCSFTSSTRCPRLCVWQKLTFLAFKALCKHFAKAAKVLEIKYLFIVIVILTIVAVVIITVMMTATKEVMFL